MADELNVTGILQGKTSTDVGDVRRYQSTLDMTGTKMHYFNQDIGTSEETLKIGDIGTIGYMIMYNHDTSNYVKWGVSTGVYHNRVRATGIYLGEPESATAIYIIADTDTCHIEGLIFEA